MDPSNSMALINGRPNVIRSIVLPQSKSKYLPGFDTDQCFLIDILKKYEGGKDFVSVKLPYDKYCAIPDKKDGMVKEGALVTQRMMNEKMRVKDQNRNWPPS